MTKTESIIRAILGPTRRDIRPLAYSVDLMAELLFDQKISMDEIRVTKYIYPCTAKRFRKKPDTAARCVERLANDCWDEGDRDYLAQIIGRRLQDIREPRDMLFYLAFYSRLGIPFYEAIGQQPALLF